MAPNGILPVLPTPSGHSFSEKRYRHIPASSRISALSGKHRSFRLFFILKQPEPRSDLSYPIRETVCRLPFMTLCCFKTTQCQTQSTPLLQETPVNRFGRIFHWHGQHPVNQSISRLSFGMRGNPFWPQILRKAYFAPMIPPHTLATRESATPMNTIQAAAVTALTSC